MKIAVFGAAKIRAIGESSKPPPAVVSFGSLNRSLMEANWFWIAR